MATRQKTLEQANRPALQQLVNRSIDEVIDATGIDGQKNRYKAMRAIAWQAFVESINAGDFDTLVKRAIAKVDDLPSGWEIHAPPKRPALKAPAEKAPVEAAAKPARQSRIAATAAAA